MLATELLPHLPRSARCCLPTQRARYVTVKETTPRSLLALNPRDAYRLAAGFGWTRAAERSPLQRMCLYSQLASQAVARGMQKRCHRHVVELAGRGRFCGSDLTCNV